MRRTLVALFLALIGASGVHGQTNVEAARAKPSAGAQSRTRKTVVEGGILNGKAVYKDFVQSYSTVEPAIDLTASSPLAFAWQIAGAPSGTP